MIYTAQRELPQAKITELEAILSGKEPWPLNWPDDDEIIQIITHDFGDGWEIDINLVKGEPTPYIDAILYEKGCEVYGWELTDKVLEEWSVVMGGVIDTAVRFEIVKEGEL